MKAAISRDTRSAENRTSKHRGSKRGRQTNNIGRSGSSRATSSARDPTQRNEIIKRVDSFENGCYIDSKLEESLINEKPSKVYCLDFHAKNLSKIEGTQKYANCRIADFSCNHIKEIENLQNNTEICELKLYSNEISSIKGLQRLKKLQNLQLQHNKIGAIGDGLKELRNLKVLNLASNRIDCLTAVEIKCCSNITFLDLSYNSIKYVEFLSAIPYVEELYLAGNQLEKCPDASCCKRLQEIDLSNNLLKDLSGIKSLPALTVINVSKNRLEDLKSLGSSRSLQQLDASGNSISSLLHIIQQLPNVEVLTLSNNAVTIWEEVIHLKNLKELKELYLEGNQIKDEIESTRNVGWSHAIHEILPTLEILDGHQLSHAHLKSGERHVMRPMTASQGLSTKMVRDQLKVMSHELSFYEDMITSRFAAMSSLLNTLPERPKSTLGSRIADQDLPSVKEQEGIATRPSTAYSDVRPTSRCGSRARIQAALDFASQHEQKEITLVQSCSNSNFQKTNRKGDG